MNRLIKFRAWDKEKHKWLDDNSWLGHYDDFYFPDLNKVFDKLEEYEILMQFTGLLDKNGKEIYEGDIIQSPPNGNEPRMKYQIVFNTAIAQFTERSIEEFPAQGTISQIRVIIGNIYENPELIK